MQVRKLPSLSFSLQKRMCNSKIRLVNQKMCLIFLHFSITSKTFWVKQVHGKTSELGRVKHSFHEKTFLLKITPTLLFSKVESDNLNYRPKIELSRSFFLIWNWSWMTPELLTNKPGNQHQNRHCPLLIIPFHFGSHRNDMLQSCLLWVSLDQQEKIRISPAKNNTCLHFIRYQMNSKYFRSEKIYLSNYRTTSKQEHILGDHRK